MKTKKHKVENAVALISVDGKVHQVVLPSMELLELLKSWFKYQGKPFQISTDPLDFLSLESQAEPIAKTL